MGLKLASAFKWIWEASQKENSKLKWVAKMDDDILLNLIEFEKFTNLELAQNSIYCNVYSHGHAKPFREWDPQIGFKW